MKMIINQENTKSKTILMPKFVFILIVNIFGLLIPFPVNSQEVSAPIVPDPSTFKAGDLIWPKKPNKSVYYDTRDNDIYEVNKKQWEKDKEVYIKEVQNDPAATDQDRASADWLKNISFDEFMRLYLGDDSSDWKKEDWKGFAFDRCGEGPEMGIYSYYGYNFPWIYVGHVGMIFFKDNAPWVVEATPTKVRKIPYNKWLEEYKEANVWHGRMIDVNIQELSNIVKEALKQEGKPYSLFYRNLNDEKKFYCSKLIWFSYYRALGKSIDDNIETSRVLWYTPKQLMKSAHVKVLFNPGKY
ncbi:MAG: hypothetical protein B6D35_06015 [Candidatus Brocadia sp. UTAMX2]|jgi:hypothetical protein|nr:MAG: hypothetical protein B6D35_06015 [Candidatus Brocadia sp. UTAMX2]